MGQVEGGLQNVVGEGSDELSEVGSRSQSVTHDVEITIRHEDGAVQEVLLAEVEYVFILGACEGDVLLEQIEELLDEEGIDRLIKSRKVDRVDEVFLRILTKEVRREFLIDDVSDIPGAGGSDDLVKDGASNCAFEKNLMKGTSEYVTNLGLNNWRELGADESEAGSMLVVIESFVEPIKVATGCVVASKKVVVALRSDVSITGRGRGFIADEVELIERDRGDLEIGGDLL